MKQCMDMGAMSHMCAVVNVFNICLNFRRWFMLCLVYVLYLVFTVAL
jgi:hypothetical protein